MRLRQGLFSRASPARQPDPDKFNVAEDSDSDSDSGAALKDSQEQATPQDSKTPTVSPQPDDVPAETYYLAISVLPPVSAVDKEIPSARRKKPPPRSGLSTTTKSAIWPWRRNGHGRTTSGRVVLVAEDREQDREHAGEGEGDGLEGARKMKTNAMVGGGELHSSQFGFGGDCKAMSDTESSSRRRKARKDSSKRRLERGSKSRRPPERDKESVTRDCWGTVTARDAEESWRRRRRRGPCSTAAKQTSPSDELRVHAGPLRRAQSSGFLAENVAPRSLRDVGRVPSPSPEHVERRAANLETQATDGFATDYDYDEFEDDDWRTLRPRYTGQQEQDSYEGTGSFAPQQAQKQRAPLGVTRWTGVPGGVATHGTGVEYRNRGRCRVGEEGKEDIQQSDPGPRVGQLLDHSRTALTACEERCEERPEEDRFSPKPSLFSRENGTDEMGKLLENDDMRLAFRQFLSRRWCAENLDFVEVVIRYQKALVQRGSRDPEVLGLAEEIETTYVQRGSIREVNIGDDMRRICLANRSRDMDIGRASMDTFDDIALELILMMNHTVMREFKASAAYATIEACLYLGPRNIRNSGATSSLTYDEEDEYLDYVDRDPPGGRAIDLDAPREMPFRSQSRSEECSREKNHLSEAHDHVADWYGIADDADSNPRRPRTWG